MRLQHLPNSDVTLAAARAFNNAQNVTYTLENYLDLIRMCKINAAKLTLHL